MFNLPGFLYRAKATSDLRLLMLKYTTLQTPSVYDSCDSHWPRDILDKVRKMVCTPFLYAGDFTNSFVGLW